MMCSNIYYKDETYNFSYCAKKYIHQRSTILKYNYFIKNRMFSYN